MGFWSRLFGRKPAPTDEPEVPAVSAPAAAVPAVSRPEEQARAFEAAWHAGASLQEEPFRALIDALLQAGREAYAMTLLRKVLAREPEHTPSLLRLGEIAFERRDLATAKPPLLLCAEKGTRSQRARANFLLAELAEAEGDLAEAKARYEAVLALEFHYPLARERAARLRESVEQTPGVGPAAATQTTLGDSTLGRFSLLRELGRGGAGAVYLAQDSTTGRQVALKVLHPHLASKDQERERFFGEARAAARVRHPGVIVVYDLDESLCALVMEYLPGGTLKDQLSRGITLPAALRWLRELAEVLGSIHKLGFVHRDLKPANLLFRSEGSDGGGGRLVLSDFGIAHLGGVSPSAAAGTLAYMAPEQRRGDAATPQVDLYALGAILYECLAGLPWLRAEDAALGTKQQDLALARERIPAGISRRLGGLLASLLAEDPDQRPPDAATVEAELRRCVESLELGEDGAAAFADALAVAEAQPKLPGGALRALARAADALGIDPARAEEAAHGLSTEDQLALGAELRSRS
jgi:hypothetical protein